MSPPLTPNDVTPGFRPRWLVPTCLHATGRLVPLLALVAQDVHPKDGARHQPYIRTAYTLADPLEAEAVGVLGMLLHGAWVRGERS